MIAVSDVKLNEGPYRSCAKSAGTSGTGSTSLIESNAPVTKSKLRPQPLSSRGLVVIGVSAAGAIWLKYVAQEEPA